MTEKPTPDETSQWHRRLASEANNRAWRLSEALTRTPDEDEEMLHAAHAAMHFWSIVGNENNLAHARQLLAHVYALLGLPGPAARYLEGAKLQFFSDSAEAWEVALAHAVAANVSFATQDHRAHQEHFQQAFTLVALLPDPEDRNILEATLRILPMPEGKAGAA
jgi:hypothetical protein